MFGMNRDDLSLEKNECCKSKDNELENARLANEKTALQLKEVV